MRRKYLHDLDYFNTIMESLDEAKTVLTFLFHKKADECMWHTYDSQAAETFCDHEEVRKEIVDLEDCVKCPHYQISTAEEVDKKLEAIKIILSEVCDHYGTEWCQEGVCDVDPNGWEGCLTQKILNVLEAEVPGV